MKKMVQKFLLLLGVLIGVAPVCAIQLQDMPYRDGKFVEALMRGDAVEVDRCLEGGANVNIILDGGKTPLMQIVDDIATLGKDSLGFKYKVQGEMFYSLCVLPGAALFGWGMSETRERSSLSQLTKILAAGTGGITMLYGFWKFVRSQIFNFGFLLYLGRMNIKLRILSLLLKHPALDLTVKNTEGKTVFDAVDAYLKEAAITNERFLQKRMKVMLLLEPMQKIESLLRAKALATGKGIKS